MKDHWMAYMVISFMTCTSMHKKVGEIHESPAKSHQTHGGIIWAGLTAINRGIHKIDKLAEVTE